jgi:hypothetical protein
VSDRVDLSPESVEAIALRVVELLRGGCTPPAQGALLTPQELADRLGVDRSYVYQHAAELGARRLGSGSKPRLRFDLEQAEAAIACVANRQSDTPSARTVKPKQRRRRAQGLGTSAPLLPIRGEPTAR